MSIQLQDFAERYRKGFDVYLQKRDEHALSDAYELGRFAVARGLSVLDLAALHHDMLVARITIDRGSASPEELVRAAGEFFLESLSAFDVVQRALQDAREVARVERHHAAILRRLSAFLADASLALDASESLEEMLQLVAEHARELTGAQRCATRLILGGHQQSKIDAIADEDQGPRLEDQLDELAALFDELNPAGGSLRMTGSDLERHRASEVLSELPDGGTWKPRGWLAARLTALDGRRLGLIQVFDRQAGDFSELDEAVVMHLAHMASAAVERAELYKRGR